VVVVGTFCGLTSFISLSVTFVVGFVGFCDEVEVVGGVEGVEALLKEPTHNNNYSFMFTLYIQNNPFKLESLIFSNEYLPFL
jgi:hypothetical protein